MRLTNKIRKEIVASMIECVYRPKIKAWEIKTALVPVELYNDINNILP